MNNYFADLHIHVGISQKGEWIKIPTSKKLTIENIFEHAVQSKGMDIIGIVDAMSPAVIEDLHSLVENGRLVPNSGGGYCYEGRLTVFLGAEIETVEENGGQAHTLLFLPDLVLMQKFSAYMAKYIKNIKLSSQNAHMSLAGLIEIAQDFSALIIPAHIFTPHKSMYGVCCQRMTDILPDKTIAAITAVELGLSADSDMADRIGELRDFSFLTNSDAHSLAKIAREYNLIQLTEPSLAEFLLACQQKGGRRVLANYGLNPLLGKYHRTLCEKCNNISGFTGKTDSCPSCGSTKIIKGVFERISGLADSQRPVHPDERPPYYYQTPLEFIPGLGAKTMQKLLAYFGTEMNIIHKASAAELSKLVGERTAGDIIAVREGRLNMLAGGGGTYGKVISG